MDGKEMGPEVLSKLCRLCMADCRLAESGSNDEILDKILECLNISLNLNDGDLPSCICYLCAGKVEEFYEFRRKCWAIQENILELIQKHHKRNPENLSELKTEVNNSDMDGQEGEVTEPKVIVTSMEMLIELAPDNTSNKGGGNAQTTRSLQNTKEECETCGKLVERVRMDGHRNRHLDLKPYQCLQSGCVARFACKVALRLHRNNVHSEAQYPCSMCDREFTSKKKYYDHKINVHSGRRFSCDVCGAEFGTSIKLNRHRVIHSNERPYACQLCSKAFYRNSNLKVHMRSHTKEKPFVCPLCSKPFGYSRLVKEHLSRFHAKTVTEGYVTELPIKSEAYVVSA